MENLESEIIQNAVNGLIKKLDGLMMEGLELKGFKFENQTELIQFISSRVTCHDRQGIQEKIYLVDNVPFFLHKYAINFCDTINDNNTFTANYGEFKFL